ncbi:MAG: ABC transporter ATP-binding protein [Tannerellaceae bacterium]|nr:ABC transporter ATP-binding protein [Tannerellaceae bacterium]
MNRKITIETTDLSIGYPLKRGKNKLIHAGLNLSLYAGEVTCLLGLNGAGKSTLLRTLGGFQPALKGTIYLQGKSFDGYSRSELALTIGVVLTEKTNAGGITVYELVSLGRHPYTGFFGQLKKRDREIIESSMEGVGISHKAGQFVAELSDGERQKAMIAKTLAQECPVILLDEPTAFLDVTSRIETMALLRRLAREEQKSILLSTHDMDAAIQMGDRLWLLEKNRKLAVGTPEDLIMDGCFGSFFNKEGIVFDSSTGRLSAVAPARPVGIEGDFQTAYWVGNAMLKNGYLPSPVNASYLNISCVSPKKIILQPVGGLELTVCSVAELIEKVQQIQSGK